MLTDGPTGRGGKPAQSGAPAASRAVAHARVQVRHAQGAASDPDGTSLMQAGATPVGLAGFVPQAGFEGAAGFAAKKAGSRNGAHPGPAGSLVRRPSLLAMVPASPPAIAGTEAGQATYDSASIKPFSAVGISDPNGGAQVETVTIVVSNTADGLLTDPNAANDGGSIANGTFTVSGTAAQVSSDVDALVFTPSAGQVPYGASVTTGFTITVKDTAGGTATDSTSTVVATATAPYASLASFSLSGNQGAEPVGGLIADASGNLFGTTSFGAGQGVFEILKTANGYAGTPVMLASLGPATGYESQAGLIEDANGDLFGTTYFDGAYGDGTVFEIAKTATGYASTPTILLNFNGTGNGANPLAGLSMDANGDLFGTTQAGGTAGQGTVFEIPLTANGYASSPTVLLNFGDGSNPSTQSEPADGLLIDSNGDVFGTTQDGGTHNSGTVFEIAKTAGGYASAPTVLLNFDYFTNGAAPRATLIEDAKGDLFGTALYGGANYQGVVFEIAKTANGYASQPTILFNFNGSNGADPQGGLIADANGDLFGTTLSGGTYGDGTVFEILNTPAGYASTPITLLSFDGANGDGPASTLSVNASGTLFGTTEGGGAGGWGSVFEVAAAGFMVAKPVISGTIGGQSTTSEAPARIFAGVSVTDANIYGAESDTVGITYAGGGTVSGSSLLAGLAGSYTLTGSAAAVTAAIDSLVFVPAAGAPNSAITTSFTLTATNAPFGTQATDTTTTLTDIDPAVAPTLAANGSTSFNTLSEAPVKPLAGVTVTDLNNYGSDADTLTIVLSGSGSLSGAGLSSANGTYTLSGTAATITNEAEALVFTPVDGVPNTSVNTSFTLTDKSSAFATTAVNTSISVTDRDAAVAPSISVSGGTSLTTMSEAATRPFAAVSVADLNNGGSDTDTLTITLSGGGTLSGAGLSFANGTYTLGGIASAIASELQALVFTPVDGVPNTSVTTGFTLTDKSSAFATAMVNTAISVTDSDPAVAPSIAVSGGASFTTASEATVKPFAGVTLYDLNNNGSDSDTLAIVVSGGGTLSGTGISLSNGTYTLVGTAAAMTSEVDALVFTPVNGVANTSVSTGFTLTDKSSAFGTSVVNASISVTDSDPAVAPTISVSGGTGFTTASEAAVKPFAGVALGDLNNGGSDTDFLSITLSGGGSLSGTGLSVSNGTYTLSGTASVITGELQSLLFTPVDGVANTAVSTGFTLTDKSSAFATAAVNTAISITDSDPAVATTITVSGGTSFTTLSEAGIKPFAGVSIADPNNGGSNSDTLSITLSGGGSLSGTGVSSSNGTYVLIGTAAAISTEVEALVFTPANGVANSSVTTGFTLSDKSSAFATAAVNTAISVVDSDPAVAPFISVSGTSAIATTSQATVKPFAGVTVTDLNNGGSDTDTLTIVLSGAGSLSGTGFSSSNGTYTLTGTAATITAALDALVFTPVDSTPNTTVNTGFTLTDKSSADGTAAVNTAISVADTDPAVLPSISITGTTAFATSAEAPVKPFGGVSLGDGNNGGSDSDTLTIILSAGGSLSGTGVSGANGTYTLTGTAAVITSEVQALVFTPVFGQNASSTTTTFTLSDKSSASSTAVTNSAITVTDTDAAAASALNGMVAGQTTTDEGTIKPFANVTVSDPNAGTQQDALVITLSNAANGTLSGTGLTYLGSGSYTLNPAAPAVLNAELQALVFTPTAHQVAPGNTVTTVFSLTAVNEASLVSPTNSTTTVIATAVNDAPAIAGTLANQALRDNATIKPFATVTVTDPDLSVSDSLAITLKNSSGTATDADGSLAGTGLSKTGTGTYALSAASPATLTSELAALVFTPTAHQVNQGATVTTGFTLVASQTAGGSTVSTTNTTSSVIVTAAGIAPTVTISGGTTITDSFDAAVKPFTGVTVADLNDLGGDTDTLVISDTGLGGSFSSGLTLTGSAATINSALQNLTFTPAGSLLAENTVFSFSLTSSGYGTATVVSNAITVTSSTLIAVMPVVKPATASISAATLGKQAGPGFGFADLIGAHTASANGLLDLSDVAGGFGTLPDFRAASAGTGAQEFASDPHAIGSFGTIPASIGADTLGLVHVLSHGSIGF